MCKSVGLTVTSACTLACVPVKSCQLLACHRHGDWAIPYMTRASSSLQPNEVMRFRLTLPLGPSPFGAGPLKTFTAQRFWLFAPLSPQNQNCGSDGQGLLG